MNWNENPSGQARVADRWGLGEPGLPPNTPNYTETSLLILWEMKVFGGAKGKLDFLTSEHPEKKIAFMLPEWWKGPAASERVFIFGDVACAQKVGIFPPNVYLRVKFLSIKPTLIYSGELENEMSQLSAICPFFSSLCPFTTFFSSNTVHAGAKFSHWV